MGHRHGYVRIAAKEFHRHVHIGHIVLVREIDCALRMEKVVGFRMRFGPGIGSLNVLKRASVLQQYFHIP